MVTPMTAAANSWSILFTSWWRPPCSCRAGGIA